MIKEILTLINGNNNPYYREMPKIVLLDEVNDVALKHLQLYTGLVFKEGSFGHLEAEPYKNEQIVKLIIRYNAKIKYFDNADYHNTLFVKFLEDKDWK